ncbi:MAG: hypothetical protein M2R45_03532 [Verrucomicrobia subdivision 3 bacterium]|nr:hypothetical protein [Limisphaerales bacterium]MCS1415929.1 hypothetical protein [Limisphaerales bacterium]
MHSDEDTGGAECLQYSTWQLLVLPAPFQGQTETKADMRRNPRASHEHALADRSFWTKARIDTNRDRTARRGNRLIGREPDDLLESLPSVLGLSDQINPPKLVVGNQIQISSFELVPCRVATLNGRLSLRGQG